MKRLLTPNCRDVWRWLRCLVLPRDALTGDDLEDIFHLCGIDYPGRDMPPKALIATLMNRSIELGRNQEIKKQNDQGQAPADATPNTVE